MTIKAVVFNGEFLLGVINLAAVPRYQEFIQIPGQKHLGWAVQYVVYLDENADGFDLLLVIGTNCMSRPTKYEYESALNEQKRKVTREEEKRRKTQAIIDNPDEIWARRKFAFEARQSGKPVRDIAEEMGISASRVSELAGYWRELLADATDGGKEDE